MSGIDEGGVKTVGRKYSGWVEQGSLQLPLE